MRLKPGVWWEGGSPGDCQQVFNGSLGNLIPDEPPGVVGSRGRRPTAYVGVYSPGSSQGIWFSSPSSPLGT